MRRLSLIANYKLDESLLCHKDKDIDPPECHLMPPERLNTKNIFVLSLKYVLNIIRTNPIPYMIVRDRVIFFVFSYIFLTIKTMLFPKCWIIKLIHALKHEQRTLSFE